MRLPILLVLMLGAVFARGESNSDFPQTQNQGQDYGGRASDFANGYSQPNPSGNARPMPAPAPDSPEARGTPGKNKAAGRKSSGGNGGTPSGDEARAEDRGGNRDGDDPGGGNDGARPVDLEGARANFAAVIESYVLKRSPKGYWNYVEMKGRKARRLSSPSVDEESVRRLKGELFSGRVKFRDAGRPKPFFLQFDVDFSGVNWKVAAVKTGAAGQ